MAAVIKLTVRCPKCGREGCILKTPAEDGMAVIVHRIDVAAAGPSTGTMEFCEVGVWPASAPIAGRDE